MAGKHHKPEGIVSQLRQNEQLRRAAAALTLDEQILAGGLTGATSKPFTPPPMH